MIDHAWRTNGSLRAALATGGSDQQLLEAVLASLPRREPRQLAESLLSKFGSFARVIAAPLGELLLVKGLGTTGAALLKAVNQAALRLLRPEAASGPVLNNWDRLTGYLHAELSRSSIERLRILFLDSRYRLLADEAHQHGTVNHTPVYTREVVKRALELNASALILAHNHPSGDPTPSADDISMTQQIRAALAALSIQLFDHIIIGNGCWVSLRELGWVSKVPAGDPPPQPVVTAIGGTGAGPQTELRTMSSRELHHRVLSRCRRRKPDARCP